MREEKNKEPSNEETKAVVGRTAWRQALFSVGWLVVAVSGPCTGFDALNGNYAMLAMGVIPLSLGIAMIVLGNKRCEVGREEERSMMSLSFVFLLPIGVLFVWIMALSMLFGGLDVRVGAMAFAKALLFAVLVVGAAIFWRKREDRIVRGEKP